MSPDEYEEYRLAIGMWRSFYGELPATTDEIFNFYKKNINNNYEKV